MEKTCLMCKNKFHVKPSKIRAKYCSHICYAKSLRGKKLSEKAYKLLRKKNIGNKYTLGRIRPDSEKMNISENLMGNQNGLGYKATDEEKRKRSEWCKKMNLRPPVQRGSDNVNWKGGITPIHIKIRASLRYAEWRQSIFIRDYFTCQKCGDDTGGNLEAHHHEKSFSEFLEEVRHNLPLIPLFDAAMMYDPMWKTNVGVTVCEKCHDDLRGKKFQRRDYGKQRTGRKADGRS